MWRQYPSVRRVLRTVVTGTARCETTPCEQYRQRGPRRRARAGIEPLESRLVLSATIYNYGGLNFTQVEGSVPLVTSPAIQIVKFVNGQDADSPTGPHVPAGSTVTFTYVVTNTGNVPLSNVVVTDDKLGAIAGPASGDTNGNGLLDMTETWVYTATATAQVGQQTNVGTVTAQDANTGTPATDDNPANYFGDAPAVNIVKFANGQDANSAPARTCRPAAR